MRLWHQALIPYLPDKQLGGQWVEIRMILGVIERRGKVNHSTVNYVNEHGLGHLKAYGYCVYLEREKRGMYSNPVFAADYFDSFCQWLIFRTSKIVYPEHNDEYLQECLDNLRMKGINLDERM